jgi:hypothetical protein
MKQPGLAVLLGVGKKSSAPTPGQDADEGGKADGDLETAAGDILAAIKGNDAQALASALSSFMDMRG